MVGGTLIRLRTAITIATTGAALAGLAYATIGSASAAEPPTFITDLHTTAGFAEPLPADSPTHVARIVTVSTFNFGFGRPNHVHLRFTLPSSLTLQAADSTESCQRESPTTFFCTSTQGGPFPDPPNSEGSQAPVQQRVIISGTLDPAGVEPAVDAIPILTNGNPVTDLTPQAPVSLVFALTKPLD